MPVRVIGLGQCAFDVLGRVPFYPGPDQKAELTEVLEQGGGPVATALVTLSRLGVETSFVGRVGDDTYGTRIRSGLVDEGVDCKYLLTDVNATSQYAFIAVEKSTGRRNIFWHRGTARPLTSTEIPEDLIRSATLLHLDGLHHEASLAAARIARKNGVLTVLDGGSLREGTRELFPLIDHAVVSEKFALQLSGGTDPAAALEPLLSYGARAATVTLGGRGSLTLCADGPEIVHQPAFSVDVVDTTGCGDVFHGGYIYGVLQGWDIRRVLRFAAACSALKACALGGRTAIPSAEEVECFLLHTAS